MRTIRIIAVLLVVAVASGQPGARERLLADVRARAASDVEAARSHASINDLAVLYESRARAAGVEMVDVVDAYDRAWREAEKNLPFFRRLKPGGGWVVAILAVLALAFHDALKTAFTSGISKAANGIYGAIAGMRAFRRLSLAKYRKFIASRYAILKVPFRLRTPLRMADIYVPLRLKGSSDAALVDAQQCIRDHRRLMVVGVPGAGKSMLLKSIAYGYSTGRLEVPGGAVPVVLELSRLNDSDAPVETLLADAFDRHAFPRAVSFVKAALVNDDLMVLFDGFDEINSTKRNAAAQRIREFLDLHPGCRAVITCRSAVYNEQFATVVDTTLEVAEFTDQQVRTFLTAWQPQLPAEKSIERLMQELTERPQIMTLARNPLLLTIIAFLYADSRFELPHSRAQFYLAAVDTLIDRWNETHNRYTGPLKKTVLRHLALTNQDSRAKDHDRRTIALPTVMSGVQEVLKRLSFPMEHTEPILREIVERSGILMMIDGGERCQFAHLTLQEFFAADALREDPDGLLRRYFGDPDAWREVVKLWCGLDVDSTKVIEKLHAHDPLMAFECLVTAHDIDEDVADRLTDAFLPALEQAAATDDIVRALASAASETRTRGRRVFALLERALLSANTATRTAAATALALTNTSRAAKVLTRGAGRSVEAFNALARMGEIAVDAIVSAEGLDDRGRITLLRSIGTPRAAVRLVPYIWRDDEDAKYAAIAIASVLAAAGVEEALDATTLTPTQRAMASLKWVWRPFADPKTSSLAAIANRVAFLVNSALPKVGQNLTLDYRLGAALAVGRCAEEFSPPSYLAYKLQAAGRERLLKQLGFAEAPPEYRFTDNVIEYLRRNPDDDYAHSVVAQALLPRPAVDVLGRLAPRFSRGLTAMLIRFRWRRIAIEDWVTHREPDNYEFARGWHFRLILAVTALLTALALFQLRSPTTFVDMISIAVAVFVWVIVLTPMGYPTYVDAVAERVVRLFLWPRTIVELFDDFAINDLHESLMLFLAIVLGGFMTFVIASYPSRALAEWISEYAAAALIVGALGLCGLLAYLGVRRERAARNPLHDLVRLT